MRSESWLPSRSFSFGMLVFAVLTTVLSTAISVNCCQRSSVGHIALIRAIDQWLEADRREFPAKGGEFGVSEWDKFEELGSRIGRINEARDETYSDVLRYHSKCAMEGRNATAAELGQIYRGHLERQIHFEESRSLSTALRYRAKHCTDPLLKGCLERMAATLEEHVRLGTQMSR